MKYTHNDIKNKNRDIRLSANIIHTFHESRMSSKEHVLRVRRLYKLIFRVHRGLPAELRVIGDNYARDEFKRHKNCNPDEARIFLNEWTDYAISLAKQMKPMQVKHRNKHVGKYLDPAMLDHMSDEQIVQLYELHKAASDLSDDGAENQPKSKDS